MTFREKFHRTSEWHEKVIVIELYHLRMSVQNKRWSLSKTAQYFNVSIGLVSENLKLAKAIHDDVNFIKQPNRQEALKELRKHGNNGNTIRSSPSE